MLDYSFKIMEVMLMVKQYSSREEVLSAAELTAAVACSVGNLTPLWVAAYKDAVKKLHTLKFEEMQEIISILQSYDEDDTDAPLLSVEGCEAEAEDFGEGLYEQGMELYRQKELSQAAACFRAAAAKGSCKAEYNYALCLYSGLGVQINRTEAIKRLVSASACGILQAEQLLRYIADGQPPLA